MPVGQAPGTSGHRFMRPKVLISILNWNNAPATINCVHSVMKQSYDQYKILISDNASVDESVKVISDAFPELKVIANKNNIGYASAHKIAADYAMDHQFDLLWILNNDTEVMPDALEELIKAYLDHQEAIFGSITIEANKKEIRFAGGYELKDGQVDFNSLSNPLRGKPLSEVELEHLGGEVAELNGSSLLIPIEIIRQYGFMPEHFFLYSEETAYGYRLRREGVISILVPQSQVVHAGSQSFSSPYLKYIAEYYRMRNDLLLRKELKIISNAGIINLFKWTDWVSWFVKRVLFTLKYQRFSLKHYYRQLGTWHALLNKSGKTIAPEKFLDKLS